MGILNYSSLDTEMLGSILTRATGMPIAEYLEQKLWKPGGWSPVPTGYAIQRGLVK